MAVCGLNLWNIQCKCAGFNLMEIGFILEYLIGVLNSVRYLTDSHFEPNSRWHSNLRHEKSWQNCVIVKHSSQEMAIQTWICGSAIGRNKPKSAYF
jgi:hypothetical protein